MATKIDRFLNAFITGTKPLKEPCDERERKIRVLGKHIFLIVNRVKNSVELKEIEVRCSRRGRGLGKKALTWLCHLADKYRGGMVLEVWPFSNRPGIDPDIISLVWWYKKHGFKDTGNGDMRRKPQ
jgi:hypothetical protein